MNQFIFLTYLIWFILCDPEGSPTKNLMKVTLNLTDMNSCNAAYTKQSGSVQKIPQGIDAKKMLCAGGIKGKDTCQVGIYARSEQQWLAFEFIKKNYLPINIPIYIPNTKHSQSVN